MKYFYDRGMECSALLRILRLDGGPYLIVIVGRRGVGKTELVRMVLRDVHVKTLWVFVKEARGLITLKDFSREFSRISGIMVSFSDWKDALRAVFSYPEPLVLVFDEFQNFLTSNPEVPSILQEFIDSFSGKTKLKIIVIGSYIGMMKKLFGDYSAPLYGRVTHRIKIAPLRLHVIYSMLRDLGVRDLREFFKIYCVLGNLPRYYAIEYHRKIDWSFESLIRDLLSFDNPLLDEGEKVLRMELRRRAAICFSIMEAIAQGNKKLSAISKYTGIQATTLPKYLDELEEIELLERITPFGEKNSRRGIWEIRDNFLAFWFRYIYPYKSYLEIGEMDEALNDVKRTIDEFIGKRFERAMREFLLIAGHQKLLGIPKIVEIGTWWGRGIEINIVAKTISGDLIVGEVKWRKEPITVRDVSLLIEKSRVFKERTVPLIISEKISSEALSLLNEYGGIHINFKQIYEALEELQEQIQRIKR